MYFVLQDKTTGEIIDPRHDDFALSPGDFGQFDDWDELLTAHDLEVDLVDGYAIVDMPIQHAVDLACKGKPSPVKLYWDKQDPGNTGVAYRYVDGNVGSGALEYAGLSIVSKFNAEDCEAFFDGDGMYTGPNADGVWPVFVA